MTTLSRFMITTRFDVRSPRSTRGVVTTAHIAVAFGRDEIAEMIAPSGSTAVGYPHEDPRRPSNASAIGSLLFTAAGTSPRRSRHIDPGQAGQQFFGRFVLVVRPRVSSRTWARHGDHNAPRVTVAGGTTTSDDRGG